MKQRKHNTIQRKNVILAIALATIVFIIGLTLGNIITENKYDFLVETTQDIKTRSVSLQVISDLYKEFPCEVMETSTISAELDTLGSRLSFIEETYGKSDPNVIALKKEYNQLLIKNWMDVSRSKEFCNIQKDLILYFYSNENCESCEDQGKILTAYKNKYEDLINIYALDINIDEIALQTLIEILNVTTVPTIIYNDVKIDSFMTIDELETIKNQ